MKFGWDSQKAAGNQRKHGVSFHEAASVLGDPLSITYHDPDHSATEHRFITVGMSQSGRVLMVAHTDRGGNMKKTLYLDEEEKDLEEALNCRKWRSVRNVKEEIRKHRQYARNTLRKDKRVNIRISSTDLEALQIKAVEEGLPYQTFIASVLHKFAAG